MKDRFKFRAWDKKAKKIINWDNDLEWHALRTLDVNKLNLEFIQCTGLKDKNGKQIFEGDIVRVDGNLFEIVYEIGSFMIATKTNCASIHQFKGYWNNNVYPLSQLYFEYENEEFTINNLEIIGNIYENPELLKGGKK